MAHRFLSNDVNAIRAETVVLESGLAHRDFAIYVPGLASAIAIFKSRRSPLLILRTVCVRRFIHALPRKHTRDSFDDVSKRAAVSNCMNLDGRIEVRGTVSQQ